MILNDALLDFWIDNDWNVKMEGRRGTGKTARITAAFNRKFGEGKWKYFSAPTMDPWVDFVGVPEKVTRKDKESYLELVRPREFADDEIVALFFDELNRAKPKVIDAVMELIQFKSINGRKFKNLRVVWCATNPKVHDGDDDEEYNVEELDPAHIDRFQIHVATDYQCDPDFFHTTFPEYAETAIAWWNKLGKVNKKAQNKVSPRRLEYALKVFAKGGDMAYVLPPDCGIADLHSQLTSGNYLKRMRSLYDRNNPEEIRKALLNENFFSGIKDEVLKDKKLLKVFAPYFPNEKFNNLITTNAEFKQFVLSDADVMKAGAETLINIVEANKANPKIVKEIRERLTAYNLYEQTPFTMVVDNHYRELGPEFFGDTQRMMRIASLLQKEELVAQLDQNHLLKALVVSLAVIAKSPIKWYSSKIDLVNIKAAATKLGTTFRDMMKQAIADSAYVSYLNDAECDKKIQTVINEASLLETNAPSTGTAQAAQQLAGN